MTATLAFDVYGTLIDTQGVVTNLQTMVGTDAEAFALAWRDKQLEYAFRRGLMQHYDTFATCTKDALDFICLARAAPLDQQQKRTLLNAYQTLPAYADVADGLTRLRDDGARLYAFSNGTAAAVDTLLTHAGLRDFFIDVISVDSVKSFKPNPAVYAYFMRQSKATHDTAWLISGNPFDVVGAMVAGMKAAWVRRSPAAVFDVWGDTPTVTVANIGEVADALHTHAGVAH